MTALHVHTQRKFTTPAKLTLPVQRHRILSPPPEMNGLPVISPTAIAWGNSKVAVTEPILRTG